MLDAKPVRFVAATGLGGREKFPWMQVALVVEQVKTFWPATGFRARSWQIERGWKPLNVFPFLSDQLFIHGSAENRLGSQDLPASVALMQN